MIIPDGPLSVVSSSDTDPRELIRKVVRDREYFLASHKAQAMQNNPALDTYDERVKALLETAQDELKNLHNAKKANP